MWNPIDTEFFRPKIPVGIACVHDSANAQILRHVIEGFWTVTHYYAIGCPADFLKVIAQDETAPPYLCDFRPRWRPREFCSASIWTR